MTDDYKSFIRRNRPELASYRTKRSFWENIQDGADGKKRTLPSFGDIKRRFNENLAKREASLLKEKDKYKSKSIATDIETEKSKERFSKSEPLKLTKVQETEQERNGSSTKARTWKTDGNNNTQESEPSSGGKETFSRKSSRRRSLEKPKSFLRMTEVMDGYVPSDTDSVSSAKDLNLRAIPGESDILHNFERLPSSVAVQESKDLPNKKKSRLRRRGSDRDSNGSNKDQTARMTPDKLDTAEILNESNNTKTDSLPKPDTECVTPLQNENIEDLLTEQARKLVRQDSGDNPLKRKRDRRSQNLRQESQVQQGDYSDSSLPIIHGANDPDTLTQKTSHLVEVHLSTPKTFTPDKNESTVPSLPKLNKGDTRQTELRGRVFQLTATQKDQNTLHDSVPSTKKKYESVFQKQTLPEKIPTSKESTDISFSATPLSVSKCDDSSDTISTQLSPKVDHRYYDTLDPSNEQRWSTIDSGISVACALQQSRDRKEGKASSPVRSANPAELRRRRRESSSLSDSDDDSGISWDDLKEFRDVPLVVMDKVPNAESKNQISNVKIELDNPNDDNEKLKWDSHNTEKFKWKRTTTNNLQDISKERGLDQQRIRNASKIGARINQRWRLQNDDDLNVTDEDIEPLRTSTPNGARVPVILEPDSPRVSESEPTTSQSTTLPPLKIASGKASSTINSVKNDIKDSSSHDRPSRLSKFIEKQTDEQISAASGEKISKEEPVKMRDKVKLTRPRPLSESYASNHISADDLPQSKSEFAPSNVYKQRSRSLSRQTSPLDSMEDVLTKRSPFRVPSSLTSRSTSSISPLHKMPYLSQYQTSHVHTRTDYNPPGFYRAKSTPILYEPPAREAKEEEIEVRPVISARSASITRGRVKAPLFTPPPLQPTSLASRLLPQRRRSLQRSIDATSPYVTDDDDDVYSDSESKHDKKVPSLSSLSQPQLSGATMPSSGVFSDSDDGSERATQKTLAPSLRLRQKMKSRNTASPRPLDVSFSDSECGSEASVTRKRRRSRTQFSDLSKSQNDLNVHLTSSGRGGRKFDTLDSEKSSQSQKQMSLSKTHKTSSKLVDRESDDESLEEDGSKPNADSLKRRKDQNNNMISRQNKGLLTLEQLAEEDVISNASKLQIDLYKHKKHFEKDLAKRLEATMEQSDNLVGAIRKSMLETRAKDKVKQAMENINEVIKFDIIRDYKAKIQWYKVEISLGSYTENVYARKTSNFRVTVSCEIPNGPKLSKDIHLDFPESVDLEQLEILQIGNDLQLRVPFKTWNPPKTMDDVIEADGGNPKDAFARIGFLEKAYRSMGMPWPPEGATAHYEYLSTRGKEEEIEKPRKCLPKPPAYQTLIDSGQLKECAV